MVSSNKVQVQSCRLLGEIHGEINALPVNIYPFISQLWRLRGQVNYMHNN